MSRRRALRDGLRLRRNRWKLRRSAIVSGRPRLSVFLSSRHAYAQLIDDRSGRTLGSLSTLLPLSSVVGQDLAGAPASKERVRRPLGGNVASARDLGVRCARAFLQIEGFDGRVVFDRGGKAYHGRLAAFAEGAREGGLLF